MAATPDSRAERGGRYGCRMRASPAASAQLDRRCGAARSGFSRSDATCLQGKKYWQRGSPRGAQCADFFGELGEMQMADRTAVRLASSRLQSYSLLTLMLRYR